MALTIVYDKKRGAKPAPLMLGKLVTKSKGLRTNDDIMGEEHQIRVDARIHFIAKSRPGLQLGKSFYQGGHGTPNLESPWSKVPRWNRTLIRGVSIGVALVYSKSAQRRPKKLESTDGTRRRRRTAAAAQVWGGKDNNGWRPEITNTN